MKSAKASFNKLMSPKINLESSMSNSACFEQSKKEKLVNNVRKEKKIIRYIEILSENC